MGSTVPMVMTYIVGAIGSLQQHPIYYVLRYTQYDIHKNILRSARKETLRAHTQRIVATSCILQKAKGEVAKAAVRRYSPKVEK